MFSTWVGGHGCPWSTLKVHGGRGMKMIQKSDQGRKARGIWRDGAPREAVCKFLEDRREKSDETDSLSRWDKGWGY